MKIILPLEESQGCVPSRGRGCWQCEAASPLGAPRPHPRTLGGAVLGFPYSGRLQLAPHQAR
eukprot:9477180-Pyramimonas_sp.AAC.2